jgi:hypothetical protein
MPGPCGHAHYHVIFSLLHGHVNRLFVWRIAESVSQQIHHDLTNPIGIHYPPDWVVGSLKMNEKKTLRYDQSTGYWQGQNDFVIVHVLHETMIEAYSLCMMHGMSRLR